MIELVDFTNCLLSNRNLQYGGRAGEKRGIIFNNELWFLKFPKNTLGMNNTGTLSYVTSPLSEFIGSHVYEILGFDVHKTKLGICFDGKKYKTVCACKDFIIDEKNEMLIQYTALRNDTSKAIMERNDSLVSNASNLNEILFQLENNTILKTIPKIKEFFWDMVVTDMVIYNNDRNEDNWGVIKYKNENIYKLAPIFDNGNSFNSKVDDERICLIMEDQNRLLSSAKNGITAYESDDGERITIIDLLKTNNEDFLNSLHRISNLFDQKIIEIENFINDIPDSFNDIEIMSKLRKDYYVKTMKIRINMLKETLANGKYQN